VRSPKIGMAYQEITLFKKCSSITEQVR